jgi:hypothetical protein
LNNFAVGGIPEIGGNISFAKVVGGLPQLLDLLDATLREQSPHPCHPQLSRLNLCGQLTPNSLQCCFTQLRLHRS